jgi:hypothetical protein
MRRSAWKRSVAAFGTVRHEASFLRHSVSPFSIGAPTKFPHSVQEPS